MRDVVADPANAAAARARRLSFSVPHHHGPARSVQTAFVLACVLVVASAASTEARSDGDRPKIIVTSATIDPPAGSAGGSHTLVIDYVLEGFPETGSSVEVRTTGFIRGPDAWPLPSASHEVRADGPRGQGTFTAAFYSPGEYWWSFQLAAYGFEGVSDRRRIVIGGIAIPVARPEWAPTAPERPKLTEAPDPVEAPQARETPKTSETPPPDDDHIETTTVVGPPDDQEWTEEEWAEGEGFPPEGDPGFYLGEADEFLAHDDVEQAEVVMARAMRENPEDPMVQIAYGDVLAMQDKWSGAEAAYREATRLQPDDAQAHAFLGDALAAQEKWGDAETAYREAIRLEPANFSHYGSLALVMEGQGRFEEAEALHEKANELLPKDEP